MKELLRSEFTKMYEKLRVQGRKCWTSKYINKWSTVHQKLLWWHNTGCLVVVLLHEGQCKLWEIQALKTLSKLPMKSIKTARRPDVNKTMKVAFHSSITKVWLSLIVPATCVLSLHFQSCEHWRDICKRNVLSSTSLVTMWSLLCYFKFHF